MTTSQILHIPLRQLRLSPRNVRKTGTVDIDDLAASIAAENLLQNLVVTAANDGFYEVEDGGRRLLALQRLEADGQLASTDIPCLVVNVEQGLEAGLTANIIRQAMHPADEFAAFSQLAQAGKSTDEIAERFGKSERYIQQRLKLAKVAPEFFEMYRADSRAMTLDHLMALATTDDQEAQRAAWQSVPEHLRNATRLRDYLTRGKVSGETAIAKFVGVNAYLAAGGNIETDLFSDTVYFLDAQLLDTLAMDKLQAIADEHIAEGWSFAHAQLSMEWEERRAFNRHPNEWMCEEKYATPEDETRDAEIDARLAVIEDIDADGLTATEHQDLSDELDALTEEQDAIKGRMRRAYAQDIMAQSGVVLYLDGDGLQIDYARIKPGTKAGATAAASASPKADKKPAKKPEISEAARTTLSAHRAAAARAELWLDPNLAFALLLLQLLNDYSPRFHERTGVGIRLDQAKDDSAIADIHKPLRNRAEEITKLLDNTLKAKPTLESLVAMDPAQRMRLLAALVACSFDGTTGSDKGHPYVAAIHAMTRFDMIDHWTPSTDDFLSRLHPDLVAAAVTEAKGKEAAAQLVGLKKADRTATAAKLLAGTGWLPKLLRGPDYALSADPTPKPASTKPKAAKAAKGKARKATKKAPAKKAAKAVRNA